VVDLSTLKVSLVAGTLGQGGAERQLFYMVLALRKMGVQVRVLSLTPSGFWAERIEQLQVPVTWVGRRGSRWGRLASIIAELRRNPAHLVQSQHFFTNAYALLAARMLQLREIGAIRSTVANEIRGTGRLAGNVCLRLPRLIAANSRAAIDSAIAMGVPASKFFLLPNVVDTEQFSPAARPEGGPLRLLAVGRLIPTKRFDRFLGLLARLRLQREPRVTGLVVGSGPLEAELKRQAAQLELLPDTVEFRDAVPDMAEIYRTADILVLSSDLEGTPNVVLEAMACGLPVVATRVGGLPEVVRHLETGFLVAPEGEDELLRSVLMLVNDRDLRRTMGGRARENILASASFLHLPAILSDLYRAAIP
jgi:glycosyltransferase involved in cell wall biosynthesis